MPCGAERLLDSHDHRVRATHRRRAPLPQGVAAVVFLKKGGCRTFATAFETDDVSPAEAVRGDQALILLRFRGAVEPARYPDESARVHRPSAQFPARPRHQHPKTM